MSIIDSEKPFQVQGRTFIYLFFLESEEELQIIMGF